MDYGLIIGLMCIFCIWRECKLDREISDLKRENSTLRGKLGEPEKPAAIYTVKSSRWPEE